MAVADRVKKESMKKFNEVLLPRKRRASVGVQKMDRYGR